LRVTQVEEGDNLEARINAMEEEVVIVDTSMMEGGTPVGMQYDRERYLMSRITIDVGEDTSNLMFRWTPNHDWWEVGVQCLYNVFVLWS